ncbi:hypothetical protein GCG54_00007155 [Colletotrichum gloeosporioides]|uniref:DUF6546 domain-containing protein n=1 Tax=Colletotrichum gloeosporioides TaxID=474922 RepID=A0A8H4CN31_COLGL|nr:uncharacterized protein GCG54_00007155 [Colletotrichum gloeosporioides]KAF3806904.1 hypothetical protein GCG54_00007155 [Colletotrichum gloeosporioides]
MSSPSNRASWRRLPAEIRLEIMKCLLQDGCSVAKFAAVSREWQEVIEPKNFARITVTHSRLAEFNSMTFRNRALVCYIWLCTELEEYDCTNCGAEKNLCIMSTADHVRIGRAFTGLFSALSAWQPSDNLVLEISIHSPSDSDHWFKYMTFVPDISPENCGWKKRLPKPIQVNFDDEKHGWIAGRRVSHPRPVLIEDMNNDSPETYKRNEKWFKRHMEKRAIETNKQKKVWWESLPPVTAVIGVILRQQNRRQLTEILGKILSRLSGPQEIHYESWRRKWHFDQEEADKIHPTWFTRIFPRKLKNLRRLVIFESFTQKYPEILDPQLGVQPSQMPTPKAGKAIARASFMVDASHFFSSCEPSWKWSNLTSLALTSRLLAPDATTTQIGAMLRKAAKMAMRMPKLRVMEIWDGREGLAALFQYKSMGHGQRPVITWRATWDYALESSVIQAWKAVGMEHQGEHHWNDCVVVKEFLNVDDVRCHGDAIHHLKLSSSVIRPVSLHQIRTESRILDGIYEW